MFKISEIGNAQEGSIGIIYDKDGNLSQVFIRKQYSPSETPDFVITETTYEMNSIYGQGLYKALLLTSTHATPLLASEVSTADAEGVLAPVLESLPDGSIILVGNPNTYCSDFVLAVKKNGEWVISGCGAANYELAPSYLDVKWVNAGTVEEGSPEMEFEGSVTVFPYTIDTSVHQ